VEDRLAAHAPFGMVSNIMQGGCLCENAPGLRVEYSNMEIAATPAPRPQILVAATGDWTKDTPKFEGPAIAHIYELFNAPEKFRYVQFDFGHNYNQTSREAVYEWFGKWLPRHPATVAFKEPQCQKEPDADLRVFPDGKLPPTALTQAQVVDSLRRLHRQEWNSVVPRDKAGLKRFEKLIQPAWQHLLQLDGIRPRAQVQSEKLAGAGELFAAAIKITRTGEKAAVRATYWAPSDILAKRSPKLVVLAHSEDVSRQESASPGPSAEAMLHQGLAVLQINRFSSGEPADQFENYYCTYNRTKLQSRVRDLLTVCAAADSIDPRGPHPFGVILAGSGHAGLWTLLAAPGAQAVAADAAMLDSSDEQALLASDLFGPGLLTIGGFAGGPMLACSHPLLLHNTGAKFATADLQAAYHAAGSASRLQLDRSRLTDEEIAGWIAQVR